MALHRLVVLTNPVPGREDEFNDWYTNRHLADVVAVPGFVAAQRFEISGVLSEGSNWKYLAIYDVETDDPGAALEALRARGTTGQIVVTDALEKASTYAVLYSPITSLIKRSQQ
jgi:hypothetical protein